MSPKLQLDGEAWSAVLADLARALDKEGAPLRLCLIGSAACLFGGMDGRVSADLDIWKPASDYDQVELKEGRKQPACCSTRSKRSILTAPICNSSSRV